MSNLLDFATGVLSDMSKQPPSAIGLGQSIVRQGAKAGSGAILDKKEANEKAAHPTGISLEQNGGVDGVSMPSGQGSRGVLEPEAQPAAEPEVKPAPEAVPDSNTNPGGTVSAVTTNRRRGVGTASGDDTLPPPPTLEEVAEKDIVTEGKQVMFRDIVTPNWYEDDSFYEGMLSFGLNMLAGNDVASSFNAGAKVFSDSKALEKRQIWAQDLLAAGYDAHEVEAWIQTGDNKQLTDPMEKAAKAQAFQIGQEQLKGLVRENDPATLRNKAKLEEYDRKVKYADNLLDRKVKLASLAETQASGARAAEKHELDMQKLRKELAGTGGGDEKVSARDKLLAVNQLMVDKEVANRPVGTGTRIAKNMIAGAFGADSANAAAMGGWVGDQMYEDERTRTAQNQYTENVTRLATGATIKDEEQVRFNSYFFAYGKEQDDPKIVARKKATQDLFDRVAADVADGKAKAMPTARALQVAKAISDGSAVVLKDKTTGMVVGIRYSTGQVERL